MLPKILIAELCFCASVCAILADFDFSLSAKVGYGVFCVIQGVLMTWYMCFRKHRYQQQNPHLEPDKLEQPAKAEEELKINLGQTQNTSQAEYIESRQENEPEVESSRALVFRSSFDPIAILDDSSQPGLFQNDSSQPGRVNPRVEMTARLKMAADEVDASSDEAGDEFVTSSSDLSQGFPYQKNELM